MSIYTDPASGRQYRVDPGTGQSQWVDGPAPGGPQPFPGLVAPQPPKKKGGALRVILIVLGVLFVVGLFGSLLDGAQSDEQATTASASSSSSTPAASAPKPAATTSAAAPAKPAPKGPGIGTPVRDGKFEFVVTKVKPGPARIGNEYLGKSAQGQFILMTVKVTNIGDSARTFDGGNQRLYDTQGRKFEADTEAAIYLEGSKSFLTEINPGNSVTGVVVFDVPKGAQLAKVELHDSMFSGGVDVALR